jgi:hypothetical protein
MPANLTKLVTEGQVLMMGKFTTHRKKLVRCTEAKAHFEQEVV